MNSKIIAKNHSADPGKRFLIKSTLKPYSRASAKPTAWKLTHYINIYSHVSLYSTYSKNVSFRSFDILRLWKSNYFGFLERAIRNSLGSSGQIIECHILNVTLTFISIKN